MSHFRKKEGNNHSSAQEMLSKRLVDYFLVYTCEPQKRKQDETQQDKTNEETTSLDKTIATSPKTNTTDENNADGAGKAGNNIHAHTPERAGTTKSPQTNASVRATRTRAVHLSVASDGGIIGNGGKSYDDSSRDGNSIGLLDEATPLVANRKGFTIDPQYHGQESELDIRTNLSEDVSIVASYRSIRIPVTDNIDDEFDKSTSCGKSLHSEGIVTPNMNQVRKEHSEKYDEEEVMTPSRMRAMDSDEEDEEDHDNKLHAEEHAEEHAEADADAHVEDSRLEQSVDMDKSENIHLPTIENIGDATDPLAANFTLLPVKTAQYPPKDHPECPMNPMVSHFCFPQTLSLTTEYQMPRIHYFVLTNDKGKKMYGTCLTVWEEYQLEDDKSGLYHDIVAHAHLVSKEKVSARGDEQNVEIFLTTSKKPVYIPKVLCIMSSWPYLHSFREYLGQLYRLATMTNLMNAPIERYVLNLCDEAPAPPPGMFELQIKVRKYATCILLDYRRDFICSMICHYHFSLVTCGRFYHQHLNSGLLLLVNRLHTWPYHSKCFLNV